MAKIDCSVTVNFIRESKRMCDFYPHDCDSCPMNVVNNDCDELCTVFIKKYPERAVEIVQTWSDEHPVKTRLDDLLEKYPKVECYDDETPTFSPCRLGYCTECIDCPLMIAGTVDQCWHEPVDGGATGKAVE